MRVFPPPPKIKKKIQLPSRTIKTISAKLFYETLSWVIVFLSGRKYAFQIFGLPPILVGVWGKSANNVNRFPK